MSKYRQLYRCWKCKEFTDKRGKRKDVGTIFFKELINLKTLKCKECKG